VPKLRIDPELMIRAPGATLGVLCADVTVQPSSARLRAEFDGVGERAAAGLEMSTIREVEEISAMRKAYKACGKDPNRYRGSAEALLRRLVSGNSLYYINNVVEVNNMVSLKYAVSAGSYDLARLTGEVVFTIGAAGAHYASHSREVMNLECMPVFVDAEGPFGSPTSDSQRALIRPETQRLMLVIISFCGNRDTIQSGMDLAQDALAMHCEASNFDSIVLDGRAHGHSNTATVV